MRGGHRGERKPRSRLAGCLLWILALVSLLIILSLLFGGFRKGTKANGAAPPLSQLTLPVAASLIAASPVAASPVR